MHLTRRSFIKFISCFLFLPQLQDSYGYRFGWVNGGWLEEPWVGPAPGWGDQWDWDYMVFEESEPGWAAGVRDSLAGVFEAGRLWLPIIMFSPGEK